MKKLSLQSIGLFFAAAVLMVFLTGCENRFDLEDIPQEAEIRTRSTVGEADNGREYLGRNFYLTSSDEVVSDSRSGAERKMLARTFNIQTGSVGSNYLGVHVMACYTDKDGTLQQIEVWVNDEYAGELDIRKAEWDFVTLKDGKTVRLRQGANKITFLSSLPYFPEIDAIQVESARQALIKEDPQYNAFIALLKQQRNASTSKLEQEEIIRMTSESDDGLSAFSHSVGRSAYDQGWNWQVTPRELSNPDGNYRHLVCVPVTYTYHRKLSLSSGTHTFMTTPIEGDSYYTVDPVMYLYKIDDPHNYTYYNDDASGLGHHAQITATLPAGEYYLVIRAYSSYYASTTTGRQGLVNVFQDGYILNSQCPIAGYSVDVDSPNTGIINYFTAYTTGIAEFFLEEKGSKKVKFFGESYFYVPPMEQMWFNDARVRLTKPSSQARYNMIISSVGAFGAYYGNCDVYGSCQQVMSGDLVANSFPNLMVNDGIYSSGGNTGVYNCASWAGGLTYGWTWGGIYESYANPELVGPYYGDPNVWSSWDAFFANNPQRYAGATVYTRENADATNGEVAVWSYNGNISGVTHFSCRGTANDHPHGYAWESKPGALRRIFHPRDALRGQGMYSYGQVFAYYRDANKPAGPYPNPGLRKNSSQSISFEESVRRGLTVIEKVELTPVEKETFTRKSKEKGLTANNPEIRKLYEAWDKKISSQYAHISNPYVLMEIQEGKNLIAYCREKQQEALVFFINLYFNDSRETATKAVSHYMFCVIFSEYGAEIEAIKNDWRRNQYNQKGAYIAPVPEMFVKKFAKRLFNKLL